jgi:predicted nucleic acid-binding Zn ribbon protein
VSRSRRSPRPLSFALDCLREELAPATVLADVQRAWPAVVGAAIAAETAPTSERAGVVTVSCSAAVWAQELDLMAPVLIERLNASLRGDGIARLRCVAL